MPFNLLEGGRLVGGRIKRKPRALTAYNKFVKAEFKKGAKSLVDVAKLWNKKKKAKK